LSTPDSTTNLSAYAPIVTWLIVIIGWLVVNNQNNNRESRKELRTRIDCLRNQIEGVEAQAIKYHTSVHDENLGLKIKLSIERIANDVNILGISLSNNFSFLVFQFRKSITLNNFDSHEHTILNADNELIQNIASAIQSLTIEIEKAYGNKYHVPWYKKLRNKD